MENVGRDTGASSVADKKNKKKIIIFVSVFAVVVVGLVIAIVAVLVNRGNKNVSVSDEIDGTVEETSDEAMNTFEDIAREITLKVVEADEAAGEDSTGMSIEELLGLYQEKINSVDDVKVKAMLQAEYYMVKLSQNPGEEAKDEILNGLIEVDKILKTSDSALRVSNAASFYGDQDLADRYYVIASERMTTEDANNTNDEVPDEVPENEDVNYDDEETVG